MSASAKQVSSKAAKQVANKVSKEHLPLTAAECAALWGCSIGWFQRAIACKPSFPKPVKRGIWIAGEVLDWRNENRLA